MWFLIYNEQSQPASRLNRMNGLNMKIKIKFYAINVLVKNKTKSIVIIVNAQVNKVKLGEKKNTKKWKQNKNREYACNNLINAHFSVDNNLRFECIAFIKLLDIFV